MKRQNILLVREANPGSGRPLAKRHKIQHVDYYNNWEGILMVERQPATGASMKGEAEVIEMSGWYF
jgi:hypothetical protein